MARTPAEKPSPKARNLWKRIPLACLYLGLALGALWLGMSIPSYFRSVSPLVLEAAADGTPGMVEQAADQVGGGRAGLAKALLAAAGPDADPDRVARVQSEIADLLKRQPAYRWSGGPDPFYEQFLKQAQFLREDETHVLPTLLPRQHRETLQGFLEQSPSRNVQDILATQTLDGWDRFYPVNSTSGQPLQATILATALLEQASALPDSIRLPLLANAIRARDGDTRAMAQLEGSYVAILTLGRYFDWLQLKTLILSFDDNQQLLFAAQALQEDPERGPLLVAAGLNTDSVPELTEYLLKHGDSGWAGLATALGMGRGAVQALLDFDKPVYQPPGFWRSLPAFVRQSQQEFKAFAESYPQVAILARLGCFGLCGFFLVAILRLAILIHKPPPNHERRVLINLDSVVGAVLVTMLVWVLIEPGLLDFRPNEEGTLQIKLAQTVPDDTLETTENAVTTMIDQVTILVLLMFFVIQMLVFILCLLKIAEIRRQGIGPDVKLKLLDNEENLFDLGLYVGLGGTVASLILVVLNIVDASLMAAYASTLFGIIFVATLKIGYLRPYRRRLILEKTAS